jgi:hypothetical protein
MNNVSSKHDKDPPTLKVIEAPDMPLVEVNPEYAAYLLESNAPRSSKRFSSNRDIVRRKLDLYVDDMRRGKWIVNGESIKLDGRGGVIDGQHRLMACVIAKTAFKTRLAIVKDDRAMETVNIGIKRKGKDVLKMAGESNSDKLAPALNALFEFEQLRGRVLRKSSGSYALENLEVLDFLNRHPGMRISILHAAALKKHVGATGRLVALHYLCSRKNPILADKFFTSLADGANLDTDSPLLRLRNRLIEAKKNKRTMALPTFMVTALTIKTWNAYINGTNVSNLRFAPDHEKFPNVESVPEEGV